MKKDVLKKPLTLLAAVLLVASILSACGSSGTSTSSVTADEENDAGTSTSSVTADEENDADTSTSSVTADEEDDAGTSTPSTGSGTEETEEEEEVATEEAVAEPVEAPLILVVSFGTSYNESRDATIGAIEKAIDAAFPESEVRRAFTSQIIIDKLKERDGLEIDNVEEALQRAIDDGVKQLVVQPTHLMNGFEYTDLKEALAEVEGSFDQVVLGDPLLTSDADFDAVVKAITDKLSSYDDGETALTFMGHGTEADSNAVYPKLQDLLTEKGFENFYIGTVEAEPTLEDVMAALEAHGGYTKVVLEPLMVVAGDHANNDMAGDEDDSWKTVLSSEGYEVECILEGLGQVPAIQQIYVEHVQEAVEKLQ